MKKIAIIGLSGESIFMHLDDFPLPSVTVHAKFYHEEPGGKGYNQAVACRKLGCDVSYCSKIGDDYYGKRCIDYLESIGIRTFFTKDFSARTAVATILTSQNGENEVIVHPGASKNLNICDLENFKQEIINADILLLQYEIDIKVLKEALRIAKENNTLVILNPAPAIYEDKDILESVDILIPNFEELKKLYALPKNILIDEIGAMLAKRVNNILIVTLGSKGCILIQNHMYRYYPAYKVNAIDTTGAGDTFNAAIASYLSKNKTLDEAIQYAMAASALSVTKSYVMNAIPTDEEVCRFIKLYNLKEKL